MFRRFVLSLSLVLFSSTLEATDQLLDCQQTSTNKQKTICGSFGGKYENRYGNVIIKKNGRGFDVTIDTSDPNRGLWTCEYSGHAQPNVDGTMKVESSAANNRFIVLKKNGPILTVRDDGQTQSTFCGMGGFIDGQYK